MTPDCPVKVPLDEQYELARRIRWHLENEDAEAKRIRLFAEEVRAERKRMDRGEPRP